MDINLFERERQTKKQTNFSPRSHRGKGRDSPRKWGGGGGGWGVGGAASSPGPLGGGGGVINRPLIFNLS